MAVANYAGANGGKYPPAYVLGPDGRPWHSWRILLLPYIEQQALFDAYRFDEPWNGPNNSRLMERTPRTYKFPTTHEAGLPIANYLAVVGKETLWPGAKPYPGKNSDGSSNTILLAENDGLNIPWMEPRDLVLGEMSLDIQNSNGISSPYKVPGVALADGSLRSFGSRPSPEALRAMLTADGGETIAQVEGGWQLMDDGRKRELRDKP